MKLIRFIKKGLLPVFMIGSVGTLYSRQLAFPTAEGGGKYTVGGRGGKVCEVTNLKSSGSGSFGEAIDASGPRTVVFRISGTITGNFNIRNGNITIAGQSAPGDGICIKGNFGISASNVIIRYIRVRPNATGDALGGRGIENVILDHVSCSWSNDEVLSIYQAKKLTIQYCLISEACQRENSHRFGGIWGAENGTYHHNCFAHCDNRTPRWAGKQNETNDYRNNVTYNWGYGGCYGALGADKINMIANYYKPGPASAHPSRIAAPSGGHWHVAGNVVVGSDDVTQDNWKGMESSSYTRMNEPWSAMPIRQESAEKAYETFLAHGGCSFPNRDALDKRIIDEIRNGTTTFGKNGIIDHPNDVGGWPELKSTTPLGDSDHDGMPDEWETANSLNPGNADDRNTVGNDGYTMLEKFLNSLVEKQPTEAGAHSIAVAPSADRFLDISQSTSGTVITFHYQSGHSGLVTLKLYDVAGRAAATVINGIRQAGNHTDAFDAYGLSKGTYLTKLTLVPHDGAEPVVRTAKVLLSE